MRLSANQTWPRNNGGYAGKTFGCQAGDSGSRGQMTGVNRLSGVPTSRPLGVAQRLVVVGTSGSGKTTLAREIARRRALPHVELDALHWGPNWTEPPVE